MENFNATILPFTCSVCKKKAAAAYYERSSGNWWNKYVKDGETEVCLNCIKERPGFKDDFLKQVGMTVEAYQKGFDNFEIDRNKRRGHCVPNRHR